MSRRQASPGRVAYLDGLRVLAAFAVVVIHSTSQNWHNVPYDSWSWRAIVCYNSLFQWPVPLFVMFTGILMLDPEREVSIKDLYARRVLRMVTAYLFWSAVYALCRYARGASLVDAVKHFINGHFHLYYLGVAIALYTVVPVFRAITRDKKLMEYYLGLTFFWLILLPTLISFGKGDGSGVIPFLARRLEAWCDSSRFPFWGHYAFYFVYGLYLFQQPVSQKHYRGGLVLGAAGIAARAALLIREGLRGNGSSTPYNFCLFDLFTVTAVFLLGKYALSRLSVSEKGKARLRSLAECTFGVYLCHMLVMDLLRDLLGIDSLTLHPAVSILPHSLVVFALSLALVLGLRKISFFKKYFL